MVQNDPKMGHFGTPFGGVLSITSNNGHILGAVGGIYEIMRFSTVQEALKKGPKMGQKWVILGPRPRFGGVKKHQKTPLFGTFWGPFWVPSGSGVVKEVK